MADGVDLGGLAAARDADADVDVGEFVEADDEEGLVDLWVVGVVRDDWGSRVQVIRGIVVP